MPRKSGSRPSDPSTDRPARLAIGNLLRGILVFATVTIPFGLAFDWWTGLPANATATYIGRDRCASCHSQQMNSWQGSDHDLAMDHATPQSVLADFDDVHLEHHGAVARMYRKNEQYWVQTEGADGQQHDYQIQYVFGVRPLQQYLVEFDRPTDMPPNQVGRMQVLRWSWDTERKRWFHLDPPDVPNEKLAPDDPLHWTKSAQNWNHMCAECHSTNLQKNFDVKSRTYHTEFSEIDVSCETCHGPGSLHVQLASARSLFWDRERGYGLDKMKQHTALEEIESCAPCHSRRSGVHPGEHTDKSYFDRFDLEVLRPLTYYPDGQIRDEVYEFGSFMQSKMFHKGIRCTDCHDPHSSRVYFEDNRLCTSCHAHSPSKYDTPAHHHHAIGSTGSQCVSCHMPETPYMAIDLRRDHGLRSPRPDLSVSIQTPNACTGCHVNSTPVPGESQVDDETKKTFQHYTDWLNARSRGNESVGRELARIDQWSSDWFTQWYGQKDRPEWPTTLAAAWNGDPKSIPGLVKMIENRELPAMIRASALVQLAELDAAEATRLGSRVVRESDPLLRTAALRAMQPQPPENWKDVIASRMLDSVRLVRTEAAQMLAGVPVSELSIEQQRARHRSLDEYRDGLMVNADQAGALTMLGVLAEQQGLADKAVEAYRTAIYVQPDVTGPRSNLATLLERQGDPAEAASLRSEELKLLARDANMAPQHAGTQYRYALGLYLNQRPLEAVPVMQKACSLEPNNVTFRLMLAMLFEQLGRWDEAIAAIDVILSTEPNDPSANEVRKRITAARDRSATTPSDSMPNPSSTP